MFITLLLRVSALAILHFLFVLENLWGLRDWRTAGRFFPFFCSLLLNANCTSIEGSSRSQVTIHGTVKHRLAFLDGYCSLLQRTQRKGTLSL